MHRPSSIAIEGPTHPHLLRRQGQCGCIALPCPFTYSRASNRGCIFYTAKAGRIALHIAIGGPAHNLLRQQDEVMPSPATLQSAVSNRVPTHHLLDSRRGWRNALHSNGGGGHHLAGSSRAYIALHITIGAHSSHFRLLQ